MPLPKSEFENISNSVIGIQVKKEDGTGFRGISVLPGRSCWMDEEEQIATANAPRDDKDNPFVEPNRSLALRTAAKDIVNRRPIGHTEGQQVNEVERGPAPADPPADPKPPAPTPEAEMTEAEKRSHNAKAAAARATKATAVPETTGKAPRPAGEAAQGTRASDEVVGTPEAASKA